MASFRRAIHTFRTASLISGARPAYAAGLRASLATVLPLAAGLALGLGDAGTWMSLGGFNAALSDKGGSYRSRAGTMLTLMATGSIAAALGTLAGRNFIAALIVTFVVAFAASVLRVWGNPGVSIGVASLSVYVVALALHSPDPSAPLVRAGFFAIGVLWAMGLALVLWPLRPYRPARIAIATVYASLADYVQTVADAARLKHTSEWPVQMTPGSTTSVRTALEEARATLVRLRRGRPGAVDRGERLLVLGESADQIFGHIVALTDTLASIRGPARIEALHEKCIEILHDAAATARAITLAVEVENQQFPIPVSWNGDRLREVMLAVAAGGEAVDPQYEHAAVILDRAAQFAIAASATVEALNGGNADADALAVAEQLRHPAATALAEEQRFWDSIRAVFSPGSLIVRFALRVAIVTTVAVALTQILGLKRGYWVTITVIVILQPYAGVTLTRAVQRVLGTVLGALLAAALGAYFHDPRSILILATVFVAFCVALLPLNYAAFSVFLTPTFVLLAEASAGDWNLAEARVLNTLLGGALALLGARLLWPSPEAGRFPAYAAKALRANGKYLSTVIERFDDRSHEAGEAMRAARRAIGLATVNAEESVQRALMEAYGDQSNLAPALTVLAYTRRFTASVAALAIARHAADGTPRTALEPFRAKATTTLDGLAASLERGNAPDPLPILDRPLVEAPISDVVRARVDRLARQVTTLHDAVARMVAAGQFGRAD